MVQAHQDGNGLHLGWPGKYFFPVITSVNAEVDYYMKSTVF
jgi:hypothetical protein